MIVKLVATGDDEPTRKAIAILQQLPNTEMQVSYCPRWVADWFQCPFVRDDNGQTYFGVDGIQFFVSERMANRLAP